MRSPSGKGQGRGHYTSWRRNLSPLPGLTFLVNLNHGRWPWLKSDAATRLSRGAATDCSPGERSRKSHLLLLALQEFQKGLRGGRQQLLSSVNDTDGTDEFGHVGRECGEDAGFHLPQHAGLRQDAHSGPNRDGVLDGFDIVKFHCDVHTYAVLAER